MGIYIVTGIWVLVGIVIGYAIRTLKMWFWDKPIEGIYWKRGLPNIAPVDYPPMPKKIRRGGRVPPPKPWGRIHPEDYCCFCGRKNIVWYVSNKLWNAVIKPDFKREIICCPICFVQLAEKKGIRPTAWRLSREGDAPEVGQLQIKLNEIIESVNSFCERFVEAAKASETNGKVKITELVSEAEEILKEIRN